MQGESHLRSRGWHVQITVGNLLRKLDNGCVGVSFYPSSKYCPKLIMVIQDTWALGGAFLTV